MDFYSYCEDAAIKVRFKGKPVHDFFKPDDFLAYGTGAMKGDALDDQIVDMTIAVFLGLAEPIPADDEKRHAPQEEFVKDVLSGKKTDWDVPYLVISKNEDDIWKVYGHDGRHRAMLLKTIGYDTIPVHLKFRDCELKKSKIPTEVWCQNDKGVKREKTVYPFPITSGNFNQPYVEIEGLKKPNVAKKDDASAEDEIHAETYVAMAPSSCVEAKRVFERDKVEDLQHRPDLKIPFSTYAEFVRRQKA